MTRAFSCRRRFAVAPNSLIAAPVSRLFGGQMVGWLAGHQFGLGLSLRLGVNGWLVDRQFRQSCIAACRSFEIMDACP